MCVCGTGVEDTMYYVITCSLFSTPGRTKIIEMVTRVAPFTTAVLVLELINAQLTKTKLYFLQYMTTSRRQKDYNVDCSMYIMIAKSPCM